MNRFRRLQKSILVLFATILLSGTLFNLGMHSVMAAPGPLDVHYEVSFDGKIKANHWFPVKFTLSNPGDDVSGFLVIEIASQSSDGNMAYTKAVDLPSNSTKVVWIALPGISFDRNNNKILFYEDSIDSGNKIAINQQLMYIQTAIQPQESLFIGVLASDKDTLNYLSLLNQKNFQVNVIPLNKESLPDESLMLDGLDYLAINNFATSELSDGQIAAIQTWVKKGGNLILAGGASYQSSAGEFEELSPVEVQETVSLDALPSLAKAAGKELSLSRPFTISKGKLIAGQILIAEKGIPLFATRTVGKGSVVYAAYDLALNPLASWDGNSAIWEQLLRNDLQTTNPQMGRFDDGLWNMNAALDYFPQLVPPALGLLLLFFLIYIVIVAPVLYIVLKKWDKREWAWVVIPIIAIISSVGIFVIGASDRNSTLAQSLNIIELEGSGEGIKTSYASVFVPRGGKYAVELDAGQYASPYNQNGSYGGNINVQPGEFKQVIYVEDQQSHVEFRNVPYWSIRKFQSVETQMQPYGRFDVLLHYDANGISGEVTNLTDQDLKDVSLITYSQLNKIGDMSAGETLTFQFSVNTPQWTRSYQDFDQLLYPPAGNQDLFQQERALLITAMSKRFREGDMNTPLILGMSKEEKSSFTIKEQRITTDQTSLWLQEVPLNFVKNGQIYIPPGIISPIITSNELTYLESDPYSAMIQLGAGEFTFEYRLPQIAGSDYSKVRVTNIMNENQLEVWNHVNQQWIPYLNLQEEVLHSDYIEGHLIKMKLTNTQGRMSFQYPQISAEGTVNP